MARGLPKPWKRKKANGHFDWYVTVNIGGKQKQEFLAEEGTSDEEIQRRLLLLLNETSVQKKVGENPGFVAVMNRHLDHVKTKHRPQTYRLRRLALLSFQDYLAGEGLLTITCRQLQPFHVTGWLASHPSWGTNTRRIKADCVKLCLNWAYNEGLLKERVLERLKLDEYIPRGREVLLTVEQRRTLLEHCRRQQHKDILVALYGSGCRPGELCDLQAENVHLDGKAPFWVVKGKPTKKRKDGVRIVALTETLAAVSQRLLQQHPTGHLFRNSHGEPWTPATIALLFKRLRRKFKKKGIKMPPRIMPYGQRHCFAADLLAGGANDYDVAELMGHANTKMVHMVYGKHHVGNAKRAFVHLKEVTDAAPKAVDPDSTGPLASAEAEQKQSA